VPTCTTRSTLDATVGTTNAVPMFSPASSGRMHIFTTASRALFACNVHMPGSPEFSGISRTSVPVGARPSTGASGTRPAPG
jgi:hypothetical protein